MSTQWKKLYGPIVTPDSSAHIIYPVPANVSAVITKFSISNVTATAAVATIQITPAAGTIVLVFERSVPGKPVNGGIMEVAELEGQILNAGDTITFTDATGAALAPWISGVLYTP